MKTQDQPTGYQIGFGGTYYTLWYVHPADEYGVQDAMYCGRISTDKKKAKEIYPNYPFTGLKGDEWQAKGEFVKDDGTSEKFIFGQYTGGIIKDSKNISYVKWYWEQTRNINALNLLQENGYVLHEDGLFESEEKLKEYLRRKEVTFAILQDGQHHVTIRSNVNESWAMKFTLQGEMEEEHEEEFPWGQEVEMNEDWVRENVTWRNYKGFDYGVFFGKRSMKNLPAIVTIKGERVVDIELK